uniref:Immunoglobulin domain-containing protein n=1 Tax=Poecilia reticulata TaxID=8081 RepID=A0A3P9PHV4_POERE
MLFIYLLLMLKDGCCQEYPTTDTKTVYAGEYVRMTCARRNAGDILWIRIKSGNTPEILNEPRNIYSHIKVGPVVGFHVLQITKVRLSDSGFYFCLRVYKGNRTFMNITSLTVIESAVTTVPTSVPAHLHDSVTLHCSALRDSQNNSCPEDENLLCFRADSIQTFPGFNSTDNAEESGFKFYSEGCLYSHFRNFSLSDAQMYHCAVTKDDKNTSTEKPKTITEENKGDSRNYYTVACLLSAALAFCLAIIAFLIYLVIEINKQLKGSRNDTVALQVHEPIKGNPESQKSHEDLVYSSVSTKRKASKKRTGATASEEQDVIYTEVNVLGV